MLKNNLCGTKSKAYSLLFWKGLTLKSKISPSNLNCHSPDLRHSLKLSFLFMLACVHCFPVIRQKIKPQIKSSLRLCGNHLCLKGLRKTSLSRTSCVLPNRSTLSWQHCTYKEKPPPASFSSLSLMKHYCSSSRNANLFLLSQK